jgi:RNA polymerase sigma-70 factor (ECF subfamily)
MTPVTSPIANGVRDARIERLFHEHAAAVRARVRRVDAALADDVVSETFATALRRHDAIPAGAERAWLFVVSDHLLRNQQRGRRRATALTDALRPHTRTAQAPAEPPAVGAALSALPDRERALLTMTALEGLSATEAADRLGISSGTALNTMVRARRQLRVKLAALGIVIASLAFGIVFAEGAQARVNQPVVTVTALVRP